MKHRYPSLLIFDLILFTILLLMPSLSGFPAALRSVLLILSGLAAVWLLILISRCKETVSGVVLISWSPPTALIPPSICPEEALHARALTENTK